MIASQTGTDWEEGLYTYSAANTLSRTAAYVIDGSSGPGTLVSLSSGTHDVYIITPIAKLPSIPPGAPQGRLTNSSGNPVLSADVASATTIYFTPYNGQFCPIYNGYFWEMSDTGGELSQALSDTTKSPAAAAANGLYDMFVWVDYATVTAPVVRCTRGPVWTSTNARSMALQRLNGIWTNGAAITNGPAINRGTYVGTIACDGSGATVSMKFGAAATGGGQAVIGVWNCYNRVEIGCLVMDSTSTWTYATSSFRAANGSANNSVTFVRGLAEDEVSADYSFECTTSTTNSSLLYAGIGLDTATAQATRSIRTGIGSQSTTGQPYGPSCAFYVDNPSIGFHTLYAIEMNPVSVACTVNAGGTAQGLRFFMSG
jgi:hypothetical protein